MKFLILLWLFLMAGCVSAENPRNSIYVYVELGTNYNFVIHENGGVSGVGDLVNGMEICLEPESAMCMLYTFLNTAELSTRFAKLSESKQTIWGKTMSYSVYQSKSDTASFTAWYSPGEGLLAFSIFDGKSICKTYLSKGKRGYRRYN